MGLLAEIRDEHQKRREWLYQLADEHAFMRSAYYVPSAHIDFCMEYDAETAREIIGTIENLRAEFHLEIVKTAVEKMQIAAILIEAQNALKNKQAAIADQIATCARHDESAFILSFGGLNDLAEKNRRVTAGTLIDPESIVTNMARLTELYATVARGGISDTLERQMPWQLVDKIFTLRCDYADAAIESAHYNLALIDNNHAYIRHMQAFMEMGTLPPNPLLGQKLSSMMEETSGALARSEKELQSINRFIGGIYEMGDDLCGSREFEVHHYHPVSIRTIGIFNP